MIFNVRFTHRGQRDEVAICRASPTGSARRVVDRLVATFLRQRALQRVLVRRYVRVCE